MGAAHEQKNILPVVMSSRSPSWRAKYEFETIVFINQVLVHHHSSDEKPPMLATGSTPRSCLGQDRVPCQTKKLQGPPRRRITSIVG
jgi:hypothetical protein